MRVLYLAKLKRIQNGAIFAAHPVHRAQKLHRAQVALMSNDCYRSSRCLGSRCSLYLRDFSNVYVDTVSHRYMQWHFRTVVCFHH